MIKKIFSVYLGLIALNVTGQNSIKVLEDFHFADQEYALYINPQDSENLPFYLVDKAKLAKLKESWIADLESDDVMNYCGYDYYIYITQYDSIVSSINLNSSCGQAVLYQDGKKSIFNFQHNFKMILIKKPMPKV